jgi:hypothetical protein
LPDIALELRLSRFRNFSPSAALIRNLDWSPSVAPLDGRKSRDRV